MGTAKEVARHRIHRGEARPAAAVAGMRARAADAEVAGAGRARASAGARPSGWRAPRRGDLVRLGRLPALWLRR